MDLARRSSPRARVARAVASAALASLALAAVGCALRSGSSNLEPPTDPQAEAASVARGQTVWDRSCAPCHGATGRGDGPLAAEYDPPPTDLVASGVHVSVRGIEVVIATPHYSGRLVKQRVTTGNREMPAWKDILSPQQIDDVVAYVRALIARHDAGG